MASVNGLWRRNTPPTSLQIWVKRASCRHLSNFHRCVSKIRHNQSILERLISISGSVVQHESRDMIAPGIAKNRFLGENLKAREQQL